MHGRLKVRTSAEQAEAKRKEKEKKVKLYREMMASIFIKRADGDKDDDALKMTEDILKENSDVGTLWSYRREILESRLETISKENLDSLCNKELLLLQQCLRGNPKAYCVWLHRRWIMEHSPTPNWNNEKSLCDLFLKYDERNFHCWDYRRYVIKKAGITPNEEFQYSTDKIATNFSNYSAWHYRSKLLPLLHPSSTMKNGIENEALLKEYELVQNAFYTDPNDQSAWFYHKWLLGRGDKNVSVGCILVQRGHTPSIYISFNQPIKPTKEHPIVIAVGNSLPIHITESDWPKAMWSCDLSECVIPYMEDTIVSVKSGECSVKVTLLEDGDHSSWIGNLDDIFQVRHMGTSSDVLSSELAMCRELLQLEPDNKWCLLTTLQLLEAIDHCQHHEEILELFEKLLVCDPLRRGYYLDLRSRHVTGMILRRELNKESKLLDLSNKGLTKLDYTQHMLFYRTINLTDNCLAINSLGGLRNLKSIQTLLFDGNQLGAVPSVISELTSLKLLSLKYNNIEEVESLIHLKSLLLLEELDLSRNPMCELDEWRGVVLTHLPTLSKLNNVLIETE